MQLAYLMRGLENLSPQEMATVLDALREGRDSLAASIRQGKEHDATNGVLPIRIASIYSADDNKIQLLDGLCSRIEADLSVTNARQLSA